VQDVNTIPFELLNASLSSMRMHRQLKRMSSPVKKARLHPKIIYQSSKLPAGALFRWFGFSIESCVVWHSGLGHPCIVSHSREGVKIPCHNFKCSYSSVAVFLDFQIAPKNVTVELRSKKGEMRLNVKNTTMFID